MWAAHLPKVFSPIQPARCRRLPSTANPQSQAVLKDCQLLVGFLLPWIPGSWDRKGLAWVTPAPGYKVPQFPADQLPLLPDASILRDEG